MVDEMSSRPRTVVALGDYRPPIDPQRAVERLLAGVPQQFLGGLVEVVVRDTSRLSRRETRKVNKGGRKGLDLWGTYHPPHGGRAATIDLFLDRILGGAPVWLVRLPFYRDILLSKALYHEIGHHIHRRVRPEHAPPEQAAERWRRQLSRTYFRRRYWYLLPFLKPVAYFVVRLRCTGGPGRAGAWSEALLSKIDGPMASRSRKTGGEKPSGGGI